MPSPSSALGPGWHVSDHAVEELLDDISSDPKRLEGQLLDLDMKSFGLPSLSDRIDKSAGRIKGPVVLQMTRLRDVGRPSLGEQTPSGILRIFLTDGQQALSALALEKIPGITEDKTPWGTKVLLKGDIPMESQFALITQANCTVLGGRVDKLVEKWVVEKNSAKGVARKAQDDAPKWISFGKGTGGDAKGLPKNFKANDVLKAGKEEKEEEGEDEFEKKRKEKLEAVEAAEKKFAKVHVDAPKGGLSEQEKVDMMRKKMQERGEKAEERRGLRQKGRRGRGRGGDSDDEGEVPAEFARPAQKTTLFDFVSDHVGGSIPVAAPPPPVQSQPERRYDDRPTRGGGRGGRGGRGAGGQREGYGREQRDGMGRGGGRNGENERRGPPNRGGREGQGREQRDGMGRGGGMSGGYDRRGPAREERVRGPHPDTARPARMEFNSGPPPGQRQGALNTGNGRQNNNNRDGRPHTDRSQRPPPLFGDQGQTRKGDYDRPQTTRAPPSRREAPVVVRQQERGGPRQGQQTGERPSLMDMNLERDFGSLRVGNGGGGGRNGEGRRGGGLAEGDKVKAPWSDGNFYPATVVHIERDMCTVQYDEYGNISTLPQGVLLR